jgi:hypothetical protein
VYVSPEQADEGPVTVNDGAGNTVKLQEATSVPHGGIDTVKFTVTVVGHRSAGLTTIPPPGVIETSVPPPIIDHVPGPLFPETEHMYDIIAFAQKLPGHVITPAFGCGRTSTLRIWVVLQP